MNGLHAALNALTAALMRPLAGLPPWVALCLASLLFGVIAAIAFRYTSNQRALRGVADSVRANLLAMRLFKDDMGVSLRSQLGMLRASGLRLAYSLPPMLVMLVPFVFLAAQLAMYYEFRPIRPGETGYVELRVLPANWSDWSQAQIQPPDGIRVEAVVRDAATNTITWRFKPERAIGASSLRWQTPGGAAIEKSLVVDERTSRLAFVSPVRAGPSFWDRILFPGEPAFGSDSPVQRIEVRYPSRSTPIFGWDVHWIITMVVVSIIGAFAVKPFVKVQF